MSTMEAATLALFVPPPRLELSTWIESNIRLPDGLSATPGPMQLWPWQRQIADAISDPEIERVTLLKASRIGFTALTVGAIGAFCVNTPASILVLLPTEADARDFVVSDIEPTFSASPALARALASDRDEAGRDTLTSRRFPGGSLKVVAARSPRNLRRHTARVLIVDEADACEVGAEGDPIALATRRTLTFPDRKLIVGSTPIFADTSPVISLYSASDGRVFEVPCPECGAFNEIATACPRVHIKRVVMIIDHARRSRRHRHATRGPGESYKRRDPEAGEELSVRHVAKALGSPPDRLA
jgi:phage terminase large subunit GpA-like protein